MSTRASLLYSLVYKLCSNPIGVESRVTMVYKDFKDLMRNGLIVMSKELLQEREVYKLGMLRRICDAYEDALKRIKHMFALLVTYCLFYVGPTQHTEISKNRRARPHRDYYHRDYTLHWGGPTLVRYDLLQAADQSKRT